MLLFAFQWPRDEEGNCGEDVDVYIPLLGSASFR